MKCIVCCMFICQVNVVSMYTLFRTPERTHVSHVTGRTPRRPTKWSPCLNQTISHKQRSPEKWNNNSLPCGETKKSRVKDVLITSFDFPRTSISWTVLKKKANDYTQIFRSHQTKSMSGGPAGVCVCVDLATRRCKIKKGNNRLNSWL